LNLFLALIFSLNIFITGGTGFLGKNLIPSLISRQNKIFLYKRAKSDISFYEKYMQNITFISEGEVEDSFSKYSIDVVIHLATNYGNERGSKDLANSNVYFPTKILQLAILHNVSTFINTDTFFSKEIYSLGYKKDYVQSKRSFLEKLHSQKNDIKFINVRLEHVFGPNDKSSKFVEMLFIKIMQADEGETINLSSCSQKRDFIYVDEVIYAYKKILQKLDLINSGTEFQVGAGQCITVKNFVNNLQEILLSKLKKNIKINFKESLDRPGEIMESKADIAELKNIGWAVKKDLSQNLETYVNSMLKIYKNNQ